MRRLGLVLGLLGPPTLAGMALWAFELDLVAGTSVVVLAAAINSAWPLGGGMVVEGTWRVRLVRTEWTWDDQRSPGEAFLARLVLSAVTLGSFFVWVPALAFARTSFSGAPTWFDEVLGVGAVLLLLGVTRIRHRAEFPLWKWRGQLEDGVDDTTLQGWVASIDSIARPDGSVGHVGGIGAFTVGLHECLDAEAVLAEAQRRGVEGVSSVHRALLEHIASREEGDGYPVYPGGLPRASMTQRAVRALAG